MSTNGNRVAITGYGAITPLGRTAGDTWDALCQGTVGLTNERAWLEAELPGFKRLRTNLAGLVKGYDLLEDTDYPGFAALLKKRDRDRQISRSATLALRAGAEALVRAGLVDGGLGVGPIDLTRLAIVLGSGIGGAAVLDKVGVELNHDQRPHSTQMYQVQPDNPTVVVKRFFGARGPSLAVCQACASGGIAIALAALMIETGQTEIALAGGSEALAAPLVALFEATGAANDTDEPAHAVQPFDVNAGGAVLAEAAGTIVLEREEHALARKATIYGFLDGYGITGGGGSPSLMDEEGVIRAMRIALAKAGLGAGGRIAISPHATGARAGDRVEASAIRAIGSGEDGPAVTAVFPAKGNMGHTVGASGGVEAVLSVIALEQGRIPPSVTTVEPLEEIAGLLPGGSGPSTLDAEAVLSNSMGFGDQNVSILIRRP